MVNMAVSVRQGALGSGKMTLTSGESTQGHGAVSEYETLNLPSKPRKFSPLDYMDTEEDIVPQYRPPSPVKRSVSPSLITSDPSLCVTPDRPRNKGSFKGLGSVNSEMLTSKKVRFEVNGRVVGQGSPNSDLELGKGDSSEMAHSWSMEDSMQEYNPSFYSDTSNLESDLDRPRTLSYEVGEMLGGDGKTPNLSEDAGKELQGSSQLNTLHRLEGGSWKPYKSQSRTKESELTQQGPAPRSSKASEDKSLTKQPKRRPTDSRQVDGRASFVDVHLAESAPVPATPPVPVMADSLPRTIGQSDSSKPQVVVTREVPTQPRLPDYSFPFSDTEEEAAGEGTEWEHVFARPEYNSTLRQVTEINEAKMKKPQVQAEMEKILQKEDTKTEINEKAAAKVNRAGDLFSGLTLVDLPKEHLCLQLEQEHQLRAVPPRPPQPAAGSKAPRQREPDLMEFFSERFVRDPADFSLNFPAPSESLSTADPIVAFDLYRHNRTWEDD